MTIEKPLWMRPGTSEHLMAPSPVCTHEHVEQIGTNSKGEPIVECLACGTTPDGEVCSDCFDLLDDTTAHCEHCGMCVDGLGECPDCSDDYQTCTECDDRVATVSTRGWCDGCEAEDD